VNSTNFNAPGSNGGIFVSSGGFATGTLVNSGGLEVVFSAGAESGATVGDGGFLVVSSGGTTTSVSLVGKPRACRRSQLSSRTRCRRTESR
jgi:autotransporter passenger strand-loop-strand repeat protein